jgi:hypothetical protein
VLQVTNGRRSLETIAFLSMLANLFGLLITYRLIRQLIENWILQLACLMCIAFLPCIMIHAVVLASDAFTLPIFVGILTLLAGLIRSRFTRGFWRHRVLGITTLLALGIGTKFTFESQAVGLLATLCVFPFDKPIEKISGSLGLASNRSGWSSWLRLGSFQFEKYPGSRNHRVCHDTLELVFFHPRDVHIFRAPEYAERVRGAAPTDAFTPHGPYELLVVHRYSYPALLHLAIFTDILNIYQHDPSDNYFGTRTQANASRMRIAVKGGLIFSLSCFFLTALGLATTFI